MAAKKSPKRFRSPRVGRPDRLRARDKSLEEARPQPRWTFLTNHAHVLICLSEAAEVRVRDVALRVNITERAVQRILAKLEDAGYIERRREGRRNVYAVHPERALRHPIEAHRNVAALLALGQSS